MPVPRHPVPAAAAADAVSPAADRAATRASVLAVVQRTEALVAEETRVLQERLPYDAAAFNNRKGQALLDLSLALRALGPARRDEDLLRRLSALRETLDLNRRIVDLHLGALREITAVLAEAMRGAECDGTYAPTLATSRRRS
jgi:hypothetical protein